MGETMQFERLGPYKIGNRLGRGGMGAVFAGINVETGQPAAVKVLNPHLADDEGFRERFELEIDTLKKLNHPNIVRMYGYGEQEGHLFYAMELVTGHSVEEELGLGRRFTWREVVGHAVKLCKALRHAHDHGVIHRDLKPANLLLADDDNEIKLTDFGIARLFGNNRLTVDGALVGTAEYMSPEQAAGERVTPQSDLYSLGGVMYAMLAGRPPFRTTSLPEMLHKQRFEQPPLLSRFVTGIPPELEELVARLLSKEPQARAPNALVLGRQLAAMEHGLSIIRQSSTESGATNVGNELPLPADQTVATRSVVPNPISPTRVAEHLPPNFGYDPDASTMLAPPPSGLLRPASLPATKQSLEPPTSSPAPSSEAESALAPPAGSPAAHGKTVVKSAVDNGVEPPPPPQRQAQPATRSGRFTTVEEDHHLQEELQRRSDRQPVVAQILLLAISLLMILGIVWYFTRPLTSDKLFERIQLAAADGDLSDIEQFLKRFPDDSRVAEVKNYQDETELQQLERRFQTRVHLMAHDESLSPIERDYLEATNWLSTDPERAMEKLQAIVAFYGAVADPSEHTAECIKLAKRQLRQLHDQMSKTIPTYQNLIDASLNHAEDLKQTSPEQARAIWQSIVTLYGDKSWAAAQVAKAKSALLGTGKTETADERR